ncbi:MAG: GTP-binding protein [Candidatus Aenigmarchaeota archaeon]|nr:GTP-binding protein [Candidatus Aenigmarchaeota archaeon]
MKIPISIITGYLGSGKTTLLRKIAEQSTKKIAILMNEFGEISIDSKVIKGKNIDMKEIAGGCVCCSLTGEFELAIKEILETVKPDMIVVETTGVAEPDALVFDIEKELPLVKLDSIITIVDADSIVKHPSIGHTGRVQIEIADILIVNKKDLVTKEQLIQVKKLMRALNKKALIIASTNCNIDTNMLFGMTFERFLKKRKTKHKSSVESFIIKSDNIFDKEKFEIFTKNLNNKIYRAKGFIKFFNGTYFFNYVAGRWQLEPIEEKISTELVFIGKKIEELEEDVAKKIGDCEL